MVCVHRRCVIAWAHRLLEAATRPAVCDRPPLLAGDSTLSNRAHALANRKHATCNAVGEPPRSQPRVITALCGWMRRWL